MYPLLAISAGALQDIGVVIAILVVAYVLVMWIAAVLWTYHDIQSRTRDQATQGICTALVAFFNVPGMLLYLMLRPQESIAERYDRQLEVAMFNREMAQQAACPACRRNIEDSFVACPYCRAQLATACESCGRNVNASWVVCPYCSAERSRAPQPAAAAAMTLQTPTGAPEYRQPRTPAVRPAPAPSLTTPTRP